MFSQKCLTTQMLSDAPPLSFCRFSKNGNYLMFSGLNSTHALYNVNSRKKEILLKDHLNENFLLEGRFVG
jgi:hypothetical protein